VYCQTIESGTQNKVVMTTIRDISTWLDLEKQKNLSAMKTLAFASAAHEFRNPLNGIISSLKLLESSVDPSGLEFYQVAKNCTNLMLFLIRDFLDLS